MWKACIILLIGFGFQRLQAQDSYNLSGKVTDSISTPLYPSTVRLISGQDTLNALTREDGSFAFKTVHDRKFHLLITMKGYQSVDRSITVPGNQRSIQLATLVLRTDYSDLDPVIITRVRPVTIADDTVSYNTAAFPVRDGSEVEDILKRLPGVEVDMDGNVIVQGKKIAKVLVDGKEFFGGDVLLAIRNLPADVVSKLQVIDDYGDQARLTGVKSGDPAKVLNIVLKPDKRNGEFGRIEAGGGNQGKYADNTFANAFRGERQISLNAGLSNNNPAGNDPAHNGGINYADKWTSHWDGSINWNTGAQSPHSAGSSLEENYYSGEQLEQTQSNQNSSHSSFNNMNTRLTYKPDNYSTLRLTASVGLQKSNNQATNNFTSLEQDSGYTKSTSGQSNNSSQSTGQNLNSNLYYEQLSPHSRRRFSAQISFGANNNDQYSNNLSTATIVTDSVFSNSLLHYQITNKAQNTNFNLNATYFLPLSRISFLELGYREQSSHSRNNILTRQPDSITSSLVTIDSLSQKQVLHSFSQDFHVGYTGKLDHLELSAGLDAQPGQLQGTVDTKSDVTSYFYFSLAPNLQATWNFDKSHKLELNYNGSPNLPSLQQLAPFTNMTNPQYPITGNPNLKQAYTNNISLHYEQSALHPTQFSGFGLGIGYTSTIHTIIQDLTLPKDSSQVIQATTYLNAGTTNNLHVDYHFTLPAFLNKHFRITAYGNFSSNHAITMTDSLQYNTRSWTWNQGLHLQLLVPDRIETNLEATYYLTHSSFSASGSLPGLIKAASISLNSKYHFFIHWILNYQLSQLYTSNGNKLQPVPATLTASLQRQFLRHNKGTISLTGYNLFNQSARVEQSSSPTGYTQTASMLTGRYFLISFTLKFNKFRK